MEVQLDRTPPLIVAAAKGDETTVKTLLANDKASINSKDNAGRTALCHAAKVKHEAIFHLLLAEPSVDVSVKDDRLDSAHVCGHTGTRCRG